MDHSAKVLRDSPIQVHGSYFCVLASKSACRPYAPFFSGFGSKPGSKSSITAFHGIHSQYRPKEHGFEVSGRLASMPWRTSGCAWCTSNYGSTCRPRSTTGKFLDQSVIWIPNYRRSIIESNVCWFGCAYQLTFFIWVKLFLRGGQGIFLV